MENVITYSVILVPLGKGGHDAHAAIDRRNGLKASEVKALPTKDGYHWVNTGWSNPNPGTWIDG